MLFRILPRSFIVGCATLGPLGYWGRAPGLNGSIAGLVLYTALFFPLSLFAQLVVGAFFCYLAVLFCGEAEYRLAQHDPGFIILDEFVAMPWAFLGLQDVMSAYPMWVVMILGLLIFRLLDVFKPWGIARLQKYSHGVGVVLDDIAAALATCLCLHLIFLILDFV